VETLDNRDLVSRIIVEFPKQERWEELFGNYKNLKSMLMEKYGNFSSCVERFQNSYIRTDGEFPRFSSYKISITLLFSNMSWRKSSLSIYKNSKNFINLGPSS